jgi:hypothetical protein
MDAIMSNARDAGHQYATIAEKIALLLTYTPTISMFMMGVPRRGIIGLCTTIAQMKQLRSGESVEDWVNLQVQSNASLLSKGVLNVQKLTCNADLTTWRNFF